MFYLIADKKADHPFYHEGMAVHLYAMEELCYFMETNMYLIDSGWIQEELFAWVETELGDAELAADLRSLYRKTGDVYSCAELIFRSSGLYGTGELHQISDLLDQMHGKTRMERRKMSGDLFLDTGKYRQAAYTYMELLFGDYDTRMEDELHGDVLHNLGVVYARLFLFPEAAEMFAQAYAITEKEESRDAYLYAMNYVDDSHPTKQQILDLNFNVMRDALNHLTEVSDKQEYYVERKAVSEAADAFDWKERQALLLRRWVDEYKMMA